MKILYKFKQLFGKINRQDFPIKATICIGLIGLLIGLFSQPIWYYILPSKEASNIQNNTGNGVGIINTGSGVINIEQKGLSSEQFNTLLAELRGIGKDLEADNRILKILLDQIDEKDLSIFKLKSIINEQSTKLKSLLANEYISDELKVLIKNGNLIEAEELSDQYYESVVKNEETKLAQKLYERAKIKIIRFKYSEAMKSLDKAVLLDPSALYYSRDAGILSIKLGQYDKALEYLSLYLKKVEGNYADKGFLLADAYANLGGVWHNKHNYNKAITFYTKSLKSNIKFFGEEHPQVANDYNNLASTYTRLGLYDKSIKHLELSLKMNIRYFGEKHPSVATNRINLGAVWQYKKEYTKAISYYEMALKSDIEFYNDKHPEVANDLLNLGSAFYQSGQFDKAVNSLIPASEIYLEVYGTEHQATKTTISLLNEAKDKLKFNPSSSK
jgi:tetratricopeptide (TPR) repeat protein